MPTVYTINAWVSTLKKKSICLLSLTFGLYILASALYVANSFQISLNSNTSISLSMKYTQVSLRVSSNYLVLPVTWAKSEIAPFQFENIAWQRYITKNLRKTPAAIFNDFEWESQIFERKFTRTHKTYQTVRVILVSWWSFISTVYKYQLVLYFKHHHTVTIFQCQWSNPEYYGEIYQINSPGPLFTKRTGVLS